MKNINNAFSLAIEYVHTLDLSGITKDNYYDWIDSNREKVLSISKDYMADSYIDLRYSNEQFYLETFEEALKHAIERQIVPISSWDIAKKLIRDNPQYPHEQPDPKISVYPEELMNKYRELLDQQPVQFKWNDKNNPDVLWKGTFMSAWHDGEKIDRKILGMKPTYFYIGLGIFFLTIYELCKSK